MPWYAAFVRKVLVGFDSVSFSSFDRARLSILDSYSLAEGSHHNSISPNLYFGIRSSFDSKSLFHAGVFVEQPRMRSDLYHCLSSLSVVGMHCDQKQLGEERHYLSLQETLHHEAKSGQELKQEPGGRN